MAHRFIHVDCLFESQVQRYLPQSNKCHFGTVVPLPILEQAAVPRPNIWPRRHSELRHHEEDIRRELRSYADHGWFTAVA